MMPTDLHFSGGIVGFLVVIVTDASEDWIGLDWKLRGSNFTSSAGGVSDHA